VKPEPFRIEPIFSPRPWGARSLAPLFPEKSNLPEPLGEAWLTGVDCKVASGPFAGKTLGEAWHEMPPEWRGAPFTEPGDFPILVKFIFPNDKLSIQVHPNDAYAAAHEKAAGGRGKTEMWHVVQAEPGANVLVGTKPDITKEEIVDAIAHNALERLLEKHPVYNGDTFFVPAGTPHTIGPGMTLCEVQEYSDLTYRLYDYGRTDAKGNPRELHVEKALDVMKFGKTAGGKVPPLSIYTAYRSHSKSKVGRNVTLLSACRYFSAERWEFCEGIFMAHGKGFPFDIIIVLNGKGKIGWRGTAWKKGYDVWGSSGFEAGQCWFIPTPLGVTLTPASQATILRAYLPDLEALRSALKTEGHSKTAIAQTIFE